MPRLLKLKEAATELGVPPGSLRTAAQRHGLLVKMGRAIRIDPNDLPELIKSCQEPPKDQDSTAVATPACTSSATPDARSVQLAHETAERLKRLSRSTSRKGTGRPAPLHRIK